MSPGETRDENTMASMIHLEMVVLEARVSHQCIERYWLDLSSHIQRYADTGSLKGVYGEVKPTNVAPVLDFERAKHSLISCNK